MQTCASCGSAMRPLFTSMFCPNECDPSGPRSIEIDSERWWVALVPPEGKIPSWATMGWYLIKKLGIVDLDAAIVKMREEWDEDEEKNWWKLSNSAFCNAGVNVDPDGDSILALGRPPMRNL